MLVLPHVVRPKILAFEIQQVAARRAATVEVTYALDDPPSFTGLDANQIDVVIPASEHGFEGVRRIPCFGRK